MEHYPVLKNSIILLVGFDDKARCCARNIAGRPNKERNKANQCWRFESSAVAVAAFFVVFTRSRQKQNVLTDNIITLRPTCLQYFSTTRVRLFLLLVFSLADRE